MAPFLAASGSDEATSVAAQLGRRRAAAAAAWNLADEVVVIGAGDPIGMPGLHDRTYPFRPHSEYFYLTDRDRPGGVIAFDPHEGWAEFMEPVTAHELLWSGTDDLEAGVPDGVRPRSELAEWVDERSGRRIGRLGALVPEVSSDAELDEDLRYGLYQVRRAKDEVELARMRTAERATRAGFAALQALIGEGRTERALQIELEAEFFRNGADGVAFDTIVATGDHSAVLHFAPTERALADGDLLLVDAGGEHRGYASDVTRTYPVSAFAPQQQDLYETVRRSLEAGIAACRPGAEWRDVHRAAALVIGEGLIEVGILRGTPESAFELGAVTLFFPHGVGHMVGLGVRDASGVLRDREPPGPGFPRLRTDLPLEVGYTLTVEPGIYFVPPLLADPERREQVRDAVDWDRVEQMLDFGGIRLEENVLITADGCEVLTRDVPLL
jgi:Xaa-Pro aminopeptidase